MKKTIVSCVFILFLSGCAGSGGGWKPAALKQAIDSIPGRSDQDKARDPDRKPEQVLAFLGVKPGDRVLDVFSSAGWYSEVLSAAVGTDGLVYAQNPPRLLQFRDGFYDKQLTQRLADNRLTNIYRVDANFTDINISTQSIDFALLALNFHDLYYLTSPEQAQNVLESVYELLKPGGVLGIIDHAGQGNDHETNKRTHRVSQRTVERVAAASGFTLTDTSDVLRNSNDDPSKNVFDPAVKGKTDRFVLRFEK